METGSAKPQLVELGETQASLEPGQVSSKPMMCLSYTVSPPELRFTSLGRLYARTLGRRGTWKWHVASSRASSPMHTPSPRPPRVLIPMPLKECPCHHRWLVRDGPWQGGECEGGTNDSV